MIIFSKPVLGGIDVTGVVGIGVVDSANKKRSINQTDNSCTFHVHFILFCISFLAIALF